MEWYTNLKNTYFYSDFASESKKFRTSVCAYFAYEYISHDACDKKHESFALICPSFYPQSNGLAEKTVQIAKNMLKK